MLALTNTTAAPGLDRYDPDRWDGRRLRDEAALPAREAVTTFGHGPHRCPAQRFSLSAITRTVTRLAASYELDAEFTSLRPITGQIGGVGARRGTLPDRVPRPLSRDPVMTGPAAPPRGRRARRS